MATLKLKTLISAKVNGGYKNRPNGSGPIGQWLDLFFFDKMFCWKFGDLPASKPFQLIVLRWRIWYELANG